MKEIKRWEWDYKRLYIYNCWITEDDDNYLDITPIRLIIGKLILGFMLFNFAICYEWDNQ